MTVRRPQICPVCGSTFVATHQKGPPRIYCGSTCAKDAATVRKLPFATILRLKNIKAITSNDRN
jgi:hypothetical protein